MKYPQIQTIYLQSSGWNITGRQNFCLGFRVRTHFKSQNCRKNLCCLPALESPGNLFSPKKKALHCKRFLRKKRQRFLVKKLGGQKRLMSKLRWNWNAQSPHSSKRNVIFPINCGYAIPHGDGWNAIGPTNVPEDCQSNFSEVYSKTQHFQPPSALPIPPSAVAKPGQYWSRGAGRPEATWRPATVCNGAGGWSCLKYLKYLGSCHSRYFTNLYKNTATFCCVGMFTILRMLKEFCD